MLITNLKIETQVVNFTNESSKELVFELTYSSAPTVLITPVSQNVNTYITEKGTTGCVINTSMDITGTVFVQIIG